MTLLVSKTGIEIEIPDVRKIDGQAPKRWLAKGWQDLRDNAVFSIGLGVLFAAIGYVASYVAWHAPWALMTAITGFLLMAPVLAVGFYSISCAHEQNQVPGLMQTLRCWKGNGRAVMLYALLLFLVLFVWSRFNWLTTALMMHANGSVFVPGPGELLTSVEGWAFAATYLLVGFLVAAAVFSGSVVTLQLMLDRKTDPVTAVVTSLRAVAQNRLVMMRWAAIIFGLVFIGFATAYIGLVIIFPLLGHASWHAYRDLIEP